MRRKTRQLRIGSVLIGGTAPLAIQTMAISDTRDVQATNAEIKRLEEAGADIVRLAVPDQQAAVALGSIVPVSAIPIVADIHFDYRLALAAIKQGVHCIRLNPGNLPKRHQVREVVKACQDRGIPIRVGVNQGSLAPDLIDRHGGPTPAAMVESALEHLGLLEAEGFQDIKVSLKSHDVPTTISAYRLLAEHCDYPFHLGITEAGTPKAGIIKSAVGIGTLLAMGIGDTIRVSLTADPSEEVRVGWEILKALNLRERGPTLIACPSCGRCEGDLIALAQLVEAKLVDIRIPLTVAVMGCVVNGPGEGKMADLGIALGKGRGVLFKDGK
ncbi:MAG: flavodoxin-dependent (E)-4-hydroxy-3-methylbut-2-enyl-diphosphate synthase, partial [Cyanobacteria bacterium NC_groundwater_1444_Ag_S-0.65um_54_12]|nr:flavodoxin-dependent (E)-4-hydroxy-3-methylbut-2-enyl-diphosphate synthase [Cyanobacteria bacterium NC_groundwater_1444_Ag_S-0.65um_54_12]